MNLRSLYRRLFGTPPLLILAFTTVAYGQGTGTIHGQVNDPSGLALPRAQVTAILEERGTTRVTASDAQGSYVLPLLPIGTYTIRVGAQGFKEFSQQGVTLDANENARVDATLQVGAVNEKVEVTAEAPLIDTRSSVVGTLVDSRRVLELPINGRNVISLAGLLPGSSQVVAPQTFTGDRSGPTISVSGSRGNENLFLFDGSEFNAIFRNTGLNFPPPDALQEVRVLTSSFSAEYGRNAGSVFNVVAKSGTNQIHGAVWEFLRNQDLNARNFFAPGKPQLIQNQFGAAAGGPIVRNKLFVFSSYEGLRIRPASLSASAFPLTAAERQGDFSPSAAAIRNPLTGQPFPNKLIPASRIDPVAAKIFSQNLMPVPNQPGGRFATTSPTPQNNNNWLTRMDYNLSRHTIDGHYSYNMATQNTFAGQIPVYLPEQNLARSQNAAIGDTFVIRPNLLNELRISYNRFRAAIANESGKDLTDLGGVWPSFGPKIPPALAISGRVTLGNGSTVDSFQTNEALQLSDSINWTRAGHSIKAGFELLRLRYITRSFSESEGDFTFAGSITGDVAADFVLGRASTGTVGLPVLEIASHQYNTYYFVQDDWKIHPRLTLNLGIRYELSMPWLDDRFNGVTFQAGQQSTVVPSAPAGLVFGGDAGVARGLIQTDKNNFAPRIGFAWSPFANGHTSARGAYGIFYETVNADFEQWEQSQPYRYTFTLTALNSLADPLRGQPTIPLTVNLKNPLFVGTQQIFYDDPGMRTPYVQQFNLNVQHEIVRDLEVQVGYFGKLGHKLLLGLSANPAVNAPGATLVNENSRRLYQGFGANNVLSSEANSNYNGLQVQVNKRFSHGFSVQGAYTFSRSLDQSSAFSLGAGVPNVFNLHSQYGLSDFEAKHIASCSWIWDLPRMAGTAPMIRAVAGGWQINGLVSLQSGTPVNVLTGADQAVSGTNNQRPDVVGNPVLSSDRSRAQKIQQWFNPAAFAAPALTTYGNAGRNVLLGPGSATTNLGLFKSFPLPLREQLRLQFRSEFFNIFNAVNLGNPSSPSLTSGARMGQITTAADGRVIQFALKVLF